MAVRGDVVHFREEGGSVLTKFDRDDHGHSELDGLLDVDGVEEGES